MMQSITRVRPAIYLYRSLLTSTRSYTHYWLSEIVLQASKGISAFWRTPSSLRDTLSRSFGSSNIFRRPLTVA